MGRARGGPIDSAPALRASCRAELGAGVLDRAIDLHLDGLVDVVADALDLTRPGREDRHPLPPPAAPSPAPSARVPRNHRWPGRPRANRSVRTCCSSSLEAPVKSRARAVS